MDQGSHQRHKGQLTASSCTQGSHWSVHSSINQKLCGCDVIQIASCVLLFWGFWVFFWRSCHHRRNMAPVSPSCRQQKKSRMVFKHLDEHRETQAGAYFTPVASWLSFGIHFKSLASSLADTFEEREKITLPV